MSHLRGCAFTIGRSGVRAVVLTLAAIAAAPAWGSTPTWSTTGPPGGTLSDVAPAKGSALVYSITQQGVVYVQNGPSGTWSARSRIPTGNGGGLLVDPYDPRHLLASGDEGLSVSRDGGATWTGTFQYASGLAFRPGVVYRASYDGFGVSTDGGVTFTIRDASRPWFAVAALPRAGSLVAIADSGAWTSRDGGYHWRKSEEFTLPPDGIYNGSLAVDPTNANVIYASAPGELLKSTDGGESWRQLSYADPDGGVAGIHIDPARPQTIVISNYSGLLRSTNGGRTFQPIARPQGAFTRGVAFDPDAGGRLYAAGDFDSASSTDDGSTWHVFAKGLADASCNSLVADPVKPGVVYCATGQPTIARTSDGGATWQTVSPGGSPGELFRSVAVTPQAILAASDSEIRRSLDGGKTWHGSTIPVGFIYPFVYGGNAALIWGGAYDANYNTVILKSTDGGATFVDAAVPSQIAGGPFSIDRANPKRAFSATYGGVWITTDGGATWNEQTGGLDGYSPDYEGSGVMADPTNPNRLWLTVQAFDADGNFFRQMMISDDGGTTFAPTTTPEPTGNWLFGLVGPDGVLYLGTEVGVDSTADGITWASYPGLPTGGLPTVTVDAANTVYAAPGGFGVFRLG
jgi:photosystem II stability/assembly factor-like uncharacterized protein